MKLAYTPNDAAALLSISRSSIYRLMEAGDIPYFMIGESRRITHDALVSFIANQHMLSHAVEAG